MSLRQATSVTRSRTPSSDDGVWWAFEPNLTALRTESCLSRYRSLMNRTIIVIAMVVVAGSCSGDTAPDASTTISAAEASPASTATSTSTTTTSATAPVAGAGAAGIGDEYFPSLGNGGYDVEHYDLDITYEEDGTVDASTVVTATALEHLSSLNLDFAGWEIDRLTLDGDPVSFERVAEELVISPVRIEIGDGFEIEAEYHGSPTPKESEAIPFGVGWLTGPDGEQYVVAEPDAAHTWFPSNDHPLDKATFSFSITVPSGFAAAANGELLSTADATDTNTYRWSMDAPMAPYLATVVIGEGWTIVDDPVSTAEAGVPIRNFLPPDLTEVPLPALETTGEMVRTLEASFGPYPFDRYGIAVVGGFPAALENQTLSVFGRSMVDAPYFEYVLVHELAHQWFGNSVSVGQWSDIWLNEGFATFAELLWVEHRYGPAAYREETANRMEAARIADFGPPGVPPTEDLFNGTVYQRGAFVLVALRDEIGDTLFFELLHTYAEKFSNGNATTNDFITLAETVAERDLGDLFTTWLFDERLPA